STRSRGQWGTGKAAPRTRGTIPDSFAGGGGDFKTRPRALGKKGEGGGPAGRGPAARGDPGTASPRGDGLPACRFGPESDRLAAPRREPGYRNGREAPYLGGSACPGVSTRGAGRRRPCPGAAWCTRGEPRQAAGRGCRNDPPAWRPTDRVRR